MRRREKVRCRRLRRDGERCRKYTRYPDADCGRHAPVHVPDSTVFDLPDCGF
ncbi:hypothetical protein [Candidatus Poriferisodalis sp.]|uniref:hypothetical protein n=1 Tax=Candidatus Poriferisodalis sp. TaxID=3101277 RepID=UPI003B5C6AB4